MTAFDDLVAGVNLADLVSAVVFVGMSIFSVQCLMWGIRKVRDLVDEPGVYSPDGFSSDDEPYVYTQADFDAQYAELQAFEAAEAAVVTVDAERYEAAKAEMAFEVEADAAWARVGSGEMSHEEYRKRYEGASARDGSL
ncbi:MAG: hypothetical protein A3G20_06430 [Acidobacteria bacterium RIFCSPLOWO2_12_FULL_59_11]|nr:MAG: hypothetical protein A3G20_06430 [Acidobacteria bacterium RIFCSPLOWO2_12_FULL_59_11]